MGGSFKEKSIKEFGGIIQRVYRRKKEERMWPWVIVGNNNKSCPISIQNACCADKYKDLKLIVE